jgi:hypothetical protein
VGDKNLEQRIKITFREKIGKSASETLTLLTVTYGEYAMKKSSAFEWQRRFKEGREDVQVCRPKRKGQMQMCAQYTLVRSDQRLGVRLIAEELNMKRETVRQIITDGLGMRNICAKMVPPI